MNLTNTFFSKVHHLLLNWDVYEAYYGEFYTLGPADHVYKWRPFLEVRSAFREWNNLMFNEYDPNQCWWFWLTLNMYREESEEMGYFSNYPHEQNY